MIITDTAFQKLEVKPMENDAVAIVEKNKVEGEWQSKVTILTKRETLLVYHALSDIFLTPARR